LTTAYFDYSKCKPSETNFAKEWKHEWIKLFLLVKKCYISFTAHQTSALLKIP
jgi:hypothetical protein